MLQSVISPDPDAPERPRTWTEAETTRGSVTSADSSGFAALVASMLRCRRCSVLVTDSEGCLTIEDAFGLPGAVATVRIPLGRGIAGRVAAAGTPLMVSGEVRIVARSRAEQRLRERLVPLGSICHGERPDWCHQCDRPRVWRAVRPGGSRSPEPVSDLLRILVRRTNGQDRICAEGSVEADARATDPSPGR